VLASLNTARSKGTDAAIQASVNNVRAQAEIVGSQTDGSVDYAAVCDDPGITAIETDINSKSNGTAYCNDATTAWVFASPLVQGGYICTDSTGASDIDEAGTLPATGTACP
jgi:hypothetical protein